MAYSDLNTETYYGFAESQQAGTQTAFQDVFDNLTRHTDKSYRNISGFLDANIKDSNTCDGTNNRKPM